MKTSSSLTGLNSVQRVEMCPWRFHRSWWRWTDDRSNAYSCWISVQKVKCHLRFSWSPHLPLWDHLQRRDANEKSSVYREDLCSPPPPEVSTPLWCSKEGRKEKPARYCRCCSSPWRRCCHRFRGGWHRCWRGVWVWSWRRRAAGASSCWFCALWPGDSETRSSPGDEEKGVFTWDVYTEGQDWDKRAEI